MKTYQIVLDIWSGNPDIDVSLLKNEGVAGLIVRLNSIGGGLHMDSRFQDDWGKAQLFDAHGIYNVYNPWVSGTLNYQWFMEHKPSNLDCMVFPDIEVKYPNYAPASYAYDVAKYYSSLAGSGIKTAIYTGQGELELLTKWPGGTYWWAQYLDSFEKNPPTTWEDLKTRIDAMPEQPTNAKKCPGNIKLWQICDNATLPGFGGHPVDINVFNGPLDDLKAWMGAGPNVPVSTVLRTQYNMLVRTGPSRNYSIVDELMKGAIVVPISTIDSGANGVWIKLAENRYVCQTLNGVIYIK